MGGKFIKETEANRSGFNDGKELKMQKHFNRIQAGPDESCSVLSHRPDQLVL